MRQIWMERCISYCSVSGMGLDLKHPRQGTEDNSTTNNRADRNGDISLHISCTSQGCGLVIGSVRALAARASLT